MNRRIQTIIVILFNFAFQTGCTQEKSTQTSMKDLTLQLVKHFSNCEVKAILEMHDTSFVDFSNERRKVYTVEAISEGCTLFKQIIARKGAIKIENFSFSIDSLTKANCVTVKLLDKPDISINMKSCDLLVFFYPDSLYNKNDPRIIRFLILKEQIKTTNNKIKLPPKFLP